MAKRKIILNLCTSLDAKIEGPNGEFDWCLTDQDYSMTEFLARTDTIFFGRKSFEQVETNAPGAFADKQKVIFSNTLSSKDTTHQIIKGDIQKAVEEMQQTEGKDIWLFGGTSLTTSFINLNLVDELMIAVHPLILGPGKPLFVDINTRKRLTLIDNKTFSTGLVQLFYSIEK